MKLHLTVTPGDSPKCPDVTSANRTEAQEQFPEGSRASEAVSSSNPDGHRCCATQRNPPHRCQHSSSHFLDGSPRIPRHHRPLENRPVTTCGGERGTGNTTTNNNVASCKNDVQNLRGVSITRRQSFSEGFAGAVSGDPATDFASPAASNVRQRQRQRCCSSGASKRLLQLDEQRLANLIQHSMDLNGQQKQHQHSSKVRYGLP